MTQRKSPEAFESFTELQAYPNEYMPPPEQMRESIAETFKVATFRGTP